MREVVGVQAEEPTQAQLQRTEGDAHGRPEEVLVLVPVKGYFATSFCADEPVGSQLAFDISGVHGGDVALLALNAGVDGDSPGSGASAGEYEHLAAGAFLVLIAGDLRGDPERAVRGKGRHQLG